jgi:hypothetical protein
MDVLGHGLERRAMAGLKESRHLNVRGLAFHFSCHCSKDPIRTVDPRMTFHRFLILTLAIMVWIPFGPVPAAGANRSDALPGGVQPLVVLNGQSPSTILPDGVRPLLTARELEVFLQELDQTPPPWESLQSTDVLEQSERLFQFNRQRDEKRITRGMAPTTPIAFLWSGLLRHYRPELQGYTLALGPEITSTSWGLVRFKPMNIPDFMVVRIPPQLAKRLRTTQPAEDIPQIGILFIGHLIEDESLIYDFSHDGRQEGMILPVVYITDVQYILH